MEVVKYVTFIIIFHHNNSNGKNNDTYLHYMSTVRFVVVTMNKWNNEWELTYILLTFCLFVLLRYHGSIGHLPRVVNGKVLHDKMSAFCSCSKWKIYHLTEVVLVFIGYYICISPEAGVICFANPISQLHKCSSILTGCCHHEVIWEDVWVQINVCFMDVQLDGREVLLHV